MVLPLIAAGVSAGAGILNNERNLSYQKQAFNYQKQLNNLQMQREDTAVQRRYADLKAAGINPLLAAGGQAAMSAPMKAGQAPQMESPIKTALEAYSIRKMQQETKNAKTQEKVLAAQAQNIKANTSLTRQKDLTETINTMITNKHYDQIPERLWHDRIGLGLKTADTAAKFIGGGLFLRGQAKSNKIQQQNNRFNQEYKTKQNFRKSGEFNKKGYKETYYENY